MEKHTVKAPIVEALERAYKKHSYHFHIPGHTRGKGIYKPFKDFMGEKFFKCDMTDEFDGIGLRYELEGLQNRTRIVTRQEVIQHSYSDT